LLYATTVDPDAAEKVAEEAAKQITEAFHNKCYDKSRGVWQHIELLDCIAVSAEAMTYAQSLLLKRWSADYISFRTEPHQPTLKE
jgi:hypothetical protein